MNNFKYEQKYLKYKNKYLQLKNQRAGRLIHQDAPNHACATKTHFINNYNSCITTTAEGSNNTYILYFDLQGIGLTYRRNPVECEDLWNLFKLTNVNPRNIFMMISSKEIKNCITTNVGVFADTPIVPQLETLCPDITTTGPRISISEEVDNCNIFYKYVKENPDQFDLLDNRIPGSNIKDRIEAKIRDIITNSDMIRTVPNIKVLLIIRGHTAENMVALRNESENITTDEFYDLFMNPFYEANSNVNLNILHLQCENVFFAKKIQTIVNTKNNNDRSAGQYVGRKYIGIVDKFLLTHPIIQIRIKWMVFGGLIDSLPDDLINSTDDSDEIMTKLNNSMSSLLLASDFNDLDPDDKKYLLSAMKPLDTLIRYLKKMNVDINSNLLKALFVDFKGKGAEDIYGTNDLLMLLFRVLATQRKSRWGTWDNLVYKMFLINREDKIYVQAFNRTKDIIINNTPLDKQTIVERNLVTSFEKFLIRGFENPIFYSNVSRLEETKVSSILL